MGKAALRGERLCNDGSFVEFVLSAPCPGLRWPWGNDSVSVSQDSLIKLTADLLNMSLRGISKELCRLIKIGMGIENIHLRVVPVPLLHKRLNYFNWEDSKSHCAHTTET